MQVFVRNIARDIFAGEAGSIKLRYLRIVVPH